jgi:hypothetical protein
MLLFFEGRGGRSNRRVNPKRSFLGVIGESKRGFSIRRCFVRRRIEPPKPETHSNTANSDLQVFFHVCSSGHVFGLLTALKRPQILVPVDLGAKLW